MKLQKLKLDSRATPLPEEVLLREILPRLSTKSILRFKTVSKTWLSLISEHSFLAAKHAGQKSGIIIVHKNPTSTVKSLFSLSHSKPNIVEIDTSDVYKKNPASIDLVGSCNGVVCLKLGYSDKTHNLVLWNPATREVNYLPAAASTAECNSSYTGYALGFDAHSAVHKVIWLKKSVTSVRRSVKPRIFCKKNMRRRWRYLKSFTPIHADNILLEEGDALTIDGAIYWMAHPFNVLSFELSKEELREFDGPVSRLDYTKDDGYEFQLINWHVSLGAVFIKPGGDEIHVSLKNKDTSGWKKISTIQPLLGPLKIAGVFSSQVVLIFNCENSGKRKNIVYNLGTRKKRDLQEGVLNRMRLHEISEHYDTVISPN